MNYSLASITDSLHRDLVFFSSERLARLGLTTGLMYFVLYVSKNPGCTPSELGDALSLDKAYVLRCLRRLSGDGFIERRRHPTDGRATLLYPTAKGKEVFGSSQSILREWGDTRLEGFTESEKEQLFMLLSKIKTAKGRKK